MATAVAPPVTPKTSTSVDPRYTQALAQAKASLAGETAPIQAEQNASDAAFQQRQTDATGVASALSELLKPIGPAVNSIYQTAGQNQELAANGFSQGMQDALKGTTDNLNATLKSLGQNVTLDSHAGQAGDVLYGLGGYTPGTAFAKEGAAFGSAATLQAGDAILKGQQNVASLKAQAIVADQGFQAKIAELAGKLPGDVQKNYNDLQKLSLDNKKFREQVSKDKVDAAYKTATLKLANAKYNTSVDEFNAKQKLNYAKLAQSQYNADRNYNIKLANLGIAQKKLQMAAVTSAFKAANGGFTKQQMTKFQEQALGIAQQGFNGVTKTQRVSGVSTTVEGYGKISYGQAMTQMLKKGIPVQVVLASLNHVYGTPTPDQEREIEKALGPLAPDTLKATILQNTQTQSAAGVAITSPSTILEQTAPQTQHIKSYGFSEAAKHGWGDSANLDALNALWTQESGWNPNAVNPSSGAAGIPQALGHGNVYKLGDYQAQIAWGLNYIRQRYGSPLNAWAHEQQFNWY